MGTARFGIKIGLNSTKAMDPDGLIESAKRHIETAMALTDKVGRNRCLEYALKILRFAQDDDPIDRAEAMALFNSDQNRLRGGGKIHWAIFPDNPKRGDIS